MKTAAALLVILTLAALAPASAGATLLGPTPYASPADSPVKPAPITTASARASSADGCAPPWNGGAVSCLYDASFTLRWMIATPASRRLLARGTVLGRVPKRGQQQNTSQAETREKGPRHFDLPFFEGHCL